MIKQVLIALALTIIAEVMVMSLFDIRPSELVEVYTQEGP